MYTYTNPIWLLQVDSLEITQSKSTFFYYYVCLILKWVLDNTLDVSGNSFELHNFWITQIYLITKWHQNAELQKLLKDSDKTIIKYILQEGEMWLQCEFSRL